MLTLIKDLIWIQISWDIRCLHKHIGPTAQIPEDFYYQGPEELTFKVTNGSVGVIYNYLSSKINDHFHMMNYESAFPGPSRTDDAVWMQGDRNYFSCQIYVSTYNGLHVIMWRNAENPTKCVYQMSK